MQGVHITNQTVIYRIHPDARNRLTAGYMTSYFIGGAAGSLISASAPGNMAVGLAFVWLARQLPPGELTGLVARFSSSGSRKLSNQQPFSWLYTYKGVKKPISLIRLRYSFSLFIILTIVKRTLYGKPYSTACSSVRRPSWKDAKTVYRLLLVIFRWPLRSV